MMAFVTFAALIVVALVVAWSQAATRAVRAQAVADAVVLAAVIGGPEAAADAARRNGLSAADYELTTVDGIAHAVVTIDGQAAVAAATR